MQSCCVFECESYKSINDRRISYFKFPLHDEILLKKWLTAIDQRNWTPNTHTQICEIHFQPDDIERPLNKYPSLTPNAIPSIFPNRNIVSHVIDTKPIQRTNTPVAEKNKKAKILLSPVLQATPVILTSSLIDQIPTMNHNLVPVSNNLQRFRKILPKLAQNNPENPQNLLKRKENSSNTSNPSHTSNPYVIIIPTFDNTKSSSVTSSAPKAPLKSNKKPILKITVSRKLRKEEYLANINKSNGGSPVNNSASGVNSLEEAIENKDQEIVVNNYSKKKSVVYTLDSTTGDIKVTHRPLKEYSSEPISKISDSRAEARRKTRNNNNQTKTNAEIISKFNESFIKTRQSYDQLMKQKIMMLNPVHKTDEIERLEKELLKFGSSVNNDKLNNKVQEIKRRFSSSSDEDSNSLDKVFVLENLLKKNEVVIKKMKTPSITTSNGEFFITESLPNKELDLFHIENKDKTNYVSELNIHIKEFAKSSNAL